MVARLLRATRPPASQLARRVSTATAAAAPPAVAAAPSISHSELRALQALESRVNWLSSLMIHHANNERPKRDGLKVGGHQASCASSVSILTALYTKVLEPQDRVAVKPHAGPVFHALMYLMGRQSRDNLQRFRALGGVQPYPSRTKDLPEVDLSTGSVGLGAALTCFTSLVEGYLRSKSLVPPAWPGTGVVPDRPGRHIALVGDAELDEGNVFEALLETWKLGTKHTWMIVDYNRQSLDKIVEDQSSRVIDRMFRLNGWEVLTLKFGRRLRDAFERPGGQGLRQTLVDSYNDDELQRLMTNLGGHCYETLIEAFDRAAQSDGRVCFLAYTIKGFGLPLAGHRDNHGLYLTSQQFEAFRASHGRSEANQWEPFDGLPDEARALVAAAPINSVPTRRHSPGPVCIPADLAPSVGGANAKPVSSQTAFGAVMLELARGDSAFAGRLLTMAPDVTTTTSLSGFVNKRGIFTSGDSEPDNFRAARAPGVASLNNWGKSARGQHIELGIAENNLLLCMAAAGLSAELFGHRLFPVGTLYDPFVARALDSLIYGTYMRSRFMLVGTPSGLTLAPEGGAHQSIGTPLIGTSVPNLLTYEPAFADEVKAVMRAGFEHMQAEDGGAVYLRLSTRAVEQMPRDLAADSALDDAIVRGGYWHVPPHAATKVVIAFSGVVAPEAIAAQRSLGASAALLQVTSYDRLTNEWKERRGGSYVTELLGGIPRGARLVTVLDGHPSALSWLGGVHGHPVTPLGVTEFGQTGDVLELYERYEIDEAAILRACEQIC
ncbi:putative transketolase [Emiliania huxleyi CCMP1516]|uniref:Transketolase-like pyrimidine-binding domain-containing protein n=2 Tax=Emiliania huxleyi TaxID=2903 RepID=A0A0D3JQA3_EMIH1|nr:putative transketolase [Emiliania huxleyi CCMP1516]EOD25688.1 putative transketolase [Emiliania huxleyi CCMP1516]|eukprot:XP_005778117.1 putative transketolase [Emiliania huxleyi CCMP1516]